LLNAISVIWVQTGVRTNNKKTLRFMPGKPGSLTKLQKAMGHSSLNVSLTYLRGLEVAELTEEDMPMV
jgi:hypothetical protein